MIWSSKLRSVFVLCCFIILILNLLFKFSMNNDSESGFITINDRACLALLFHWLNGKDCIETDAFCVSVLRDYALQHDEEMDEEPTGKMADIPAGTVGIKPEVRDEAVKLIAERLYGISVLTLKQLASFDDRKYKLTEDLNIKNPLITNHCPYGYIIKIINPRESSDPSFIEAQSEVMNFLNKHSIQSPKPVRNVYGHYFSVERVGSDSYAVRLFECLPAEPLANVPKSEFLFYQFGEFGASMDRLLKDFYHSGLDGHKHIWMLEEVPALEQYKKCIRDVEKLGVYEKVIKEFTDVVVPKIHSLDRGVINGDLSDQNIGVTLQNKDKDNDWRVTSILDFSHVQVSCYIFELVIAMTNAMLITGDLKTGGYVLAGSTIIRIPSAEEYGILKICVAARLVQILILSAHSIREDPSNTQLLDSQKICWDLLSKLLAETEDVNAFWKATADDYLTRSTK